MDTSRPACACRRDRGHGLPSGWGASLLRTARSPGIEIAVIEYYGQFADAYQSALHVWEKGEDRSPTLHDTQVRDGAPWSADTTTTACKSRQT
jgi:hypothetical protein